MRQTIAIILLLIPLLAFSQGGKFYQLNHKDQPYYTEFNQFLRDTLWQFNQTIAYNEPKTIDEETWTRLIIEIKDTSAFLKIKRLNFNNDYLTGKYSFAAWNVWLQDRDSSSISGEIQLRSVNEEGVSLNLDLVVIDLKTTNQFIYSGERLFRTTTIKEFYKH